MAVQLRAKLRYADLANMPDDGKRYELLDGVLVVTPSPAVRHQRVSIRLERLLLDYCRVSGLGEMLHAPIDLILSNHTVLVPDIVVTDPRHVSARGIEGPPILVVEILSPAHERHDRVTKMAHYANFGVAHYWLVAPEARVIECYRNADGQFVEVMRTSEGTFLHPEFAGLSFEVNGLWEQDWTR